MRGREDCGQRTRRLSGASTRAAEQLVMATHSHLVPPHGGQLIDLYVNAGRRAELRARSKDFPSWDLTPRQIGCMNKIEFASVPFTLAPAVAELQFCGALFQPNWTIGLKERTIAESSDTPDSGGVTREFPLCFSGNPLESATLLLGSLPRPEAQAAATPRPRKRTTGRQ